MAVLESLRIASFQLSVLEYFSASLFSKQKPIYCLLCFYKAIVFLLYFVSVFSLITINSVLWQISSYLVHLVLPKHEFLPKLLIILWALFPPRHWWLNYFSVLVQTSQLTFRVHFSGKDKFSSLGQTWRHWENTCSPHELQCYGCLGPRPWYLWRGCLRYKAAGRTFMSFIPGTEKENVRRLQQQIRNHEEAEKKADKMNKTTNIADILSWRKVGDKMENGMGLQEAAWQHSRAGPETKFRLCQESRSPDKAGAKAGVRVGQELRRGLGLEPQVQIINNNSQRCQCFRQILLSS